MKTSKKVILALRKELHFKQKPLHTSKEIKTSDIYYGVIPFIIIQILLLFVLFKFPEIITWLPKKL